MTAHHFFAAADDVDDHGVTLRGDEARHAATSLRVRVGETITVADGSGRIASAVVQEVGDEVHADVVAIEKVSRPRPTITLYQALTKSSKLDDVIEKASELGVHRVVPFVAVRSIVRWDERRRARALDRWLAIAKAAAKLSKSPWLIEVATVADRIVPSDDVVLVLHESARTRVRDVLPHCAPATLGIVVGPEGGLTEDEVTELSAGHGGVSLGSRVFRTETAGIVAITVVGTRYGTVG